MSPEEPQESSADQASTGPAPPPGGEEKRPPLPEDRSFPSWQEELEERGASSAAAEELAALEQEMDELRRSFARARDDQRRRVQRLERDFQQRLDQAVGESVEGLLDVLDNLDLAIQAGETSQEVQAVVEGVGMVRDLFLQTLGRLGLERIGAVGEAFDPETAEAVDVQEVEEPERHDHVVAEQRPGYVFRGRLLRPAQVVVGKHPGGAAEAEDETKEIEPVPDAEDAAEPEDSAGEGTKEAPPAGEIERDEGPLHAGTDSWIETGEMPPPSGGDPEAYRPIPPDEDAPPPSERKEGPGGGVREGDQELDENPEDASASSASSGGPGMSPAEVEFDDEEGGEGGNDPEELDWS